MRAGYLGDLGAERFEQLDSLVEPGDHAAGIAFPAQFGHHAYAQASDVAVARGGGDGRHRGVK